jgi:hypothetical protein
MENQLHSTGSTRQGSARIVSMMVIVIATAKSGIALAVDVGYEGSMRVGASALNWYVAAICTC